MSTELTKLIAAAAKETNNEVKTLYPRPITINDKLTVDEVKAMLNNDSLFLPSFDANRLNKDDVGREGIISFNKDTLRLVKYVAREQGKSDTDRFVVDCTLNFNDTGETKKISFKVLTKAQMKTILESDESPFHVSNWEIGEDWASKPLVPKLEFGKKPKSVPENKEG